MPGLALVTGNIGPNQFCLVGSCFKMPEWPQTPEHYLAGTSPPQDIKISHSRYRMISHLWVREEPMIKDKRGREPELTMVGAYRQWWRGADTLGVLASEDCMQETPS